MMSRIMKIAVSLAVLASVTACTVIPAQVAYTGPAVGVVTVRPPLRPARPLLCPTVLPWLLRIPARAPPLLISGKRPANLPRRDTAGTAVHRGRVRRSQSAWADRRIW